jgi:hypothetical protein
MLHAQAQQRGSANGKVMHSIAANTAKAVQEMLADRHRGVEARTPSHLGVAEVQVAFRA